MIVRCARLRRTSLDSVSTIYDLGLSAGVVTRLCDRLPLVVIQTGESFARAMSIVVICLFVFASMHCSAGEKY